MGQKAQACQRVVGHIGAAAHRAAEQSFLCAQAKGARDGGDIDVEKVGQFALRRQARSGQQNAGLDVRLEQLGQLLIERAGAARQRGLPAHGVVVKGVDGHKNTSLSMGWMSAPGRETKSLARRLMQKGDRIRGCRQFPWDFCGFPFGAARSLMVARRDEPAAFGGLQACGALLSRCVDKSPAWLAAFAAISNCAERAPRPGSALCPLRPAGLPSDSNALPLVKLLRDRGAFAAVRPPPRRPK